MESYVEIFEGIMGIGIWSKRYAILNGEILSLCKDRGKEIVGRIHLQISRIEDSKKETEFKIFNGLNKIKVKTQAKAIKKKWFEAFNKMNKKRKKQFKSQRAIRTIQDFSYDENLIKEINTLLCSENMEKLRQEIAELWDLQAKLKKKSSQMPENLKLLGCIDLVEKIKKGIYKGLMSLEDEYGHLSALQLFFKRKCEDPVFLKYLEENTFKYAIEELLCKKKRKDSMTSINEEKENFSSSDDTMYYSMLENPNDINNIKKSILKATDVTTINDPILKKSFLNTKSLKTGNRKVNYLIKNLIEKSRVFQKYPIREDAPAFRQVMPSKRDPNLKINFWAILKENFGRDLTKITMPVYFNEPTSFLHKTTETLEYYQQLRLANKCEDRFLRIAYVASVVFGNFSNAIGRCKKPFNPMEGETYEFIEGDFRIVLEQVSHHPPIHCFHAESDDFIYEGYFDIKLCFSMKGVSGKQIGKKKVTLKKTKEVFWITIPDITAHNIIVGKPYGWFIKELIVVNENTGDKAIIKFLPKGWTSKDDYKSNGVIQDKDGNVKYDFYGKWNASGNVINRETGEEINLVKRFDRYEGYEQMYYFSKFAINLNNLTKEILEKIPPTDSRLRTDLRAYEHGDLELAKTEKHRLEESQRARRRKDKKAKKVWKPKWFDFEMKDRKIVKWSFNHKYWKVRKSGQWPDDLLDLYN